MSILIKGMEMPREGTVIAIYKLNCKFYASAHGTELCPLVPVPPHGDLIDRTKLYEKTAELDAQALHMVEDTMHDEDTTEWRKWSTVLTERSAFKYDVADAPTIIPASEEGE